MNILFVAKGLYPYRTGGMEIFNYYLILELNKLHNVTVITGCNQCDFPKDLRLLKLNKIRPRRIFELIQEVFYILKLRRKIDIVHLSYARGSNWVSWIVYPLMKKLFKIKYVITIHGGRLIKWTPAFPFNYCFKHANAIVGVSQQVCNYYADAIHRDIICIPPLIPFNKENADVKDIKKQYGIPKDSFVILYVGSLKNIKSPITLLEALRDLGINYIKNNRVFLIFAGDGEDKKKLQRYANALALSDYIVFTGNVEREKIPAMYKIANVYVITSFIESFSISLWEAMFNALPVIASNISVIKSYISDNVNGLLFEAGNSNQLKEKLNLIIEDNGKRQKLSHAAKEFCNQYYNFNEMINSYDNLYKRIVEK